MVGGKSRSSLSKNMALLKLNKTKKERDSLVKCYYSAIEQNVCFHQAQYFIDEKCLDFDSSGIINSFQMYKRLMTLNQASTCNLF